METQRGGRVFFGPRRVEMRGAPEAGRGLTFATNYIIILTNVITNEREEVVLEPAIIEEILGGVEPLGAGLDSDLGLVELGRRGLAKDSLERLAAFLGVSMHRISGLLPITWRTVQRHPPGRRFGQAVTEHILQMAVVAATGHRVFGEREKFLKWMDLPSEALAGASPMSLLDSRFGMGMVLDELARIAHGVPS